MRVKLTVAYRGGDFAGWQIQPRQRTVQGVLEDAVAAVGGSAARVTGASRTDAGVHAAGQVCHFEAPVPRPPQVWQRALNALLGDDVRVLAAAEARADFHARFDALGKTYRYHVDRRPVASPFLAAFAWHRPEPLDVQAMRAAAALLLEARVDQRAFATRPDADRTVRPLQACELDEGATLSFTVRGRSFLRFAVRGLVGSLVEVGRGALDPEALVRAASRGDRAATGATAPPHGLCLVGVRYPDR